MMSEAPVEAGVDDVRPAPRRTGLRHFDAMVSITAIFISAVSLYVAIEHGRTERQLVEANVWPFLREILSNGYGAEGDVAIGFSNAGVGPAKVRSYEVFYRGKPVRSGLDLLRKCCALGTSREDVKRELPAGFYYSAADQTVLRPGENNIVLMLRRTASAAQMPKRFAAALSQLSFRVCYCSVQDECWRSNLQSIRAQPVRECPAPQFAFDPNGH
jgi:hypothetical protein